jgi:hypothetical protein
VRQFVLRSGGWRGLLLAAAFLGAAGGLRAETPDVPDFRYVPAGTAWFTTARAGDLVGKVGGKELRNLPCLAAWDKQLGVALADVERVTVVCGTEGDDPVTVCHTAKACDRERVVKALADGAKVVKRNGKAFHVTGDGAAVYFASDRLFLAGADKLVFDAVEKRGPEAGSALAEALRQAGKHDVFAWGLAEANDGPKRVVRACKPWSCEGGKCPAVSLDGLGNFPVPAGFRSADVAVDVGERLVVRVGLHFADEDSARRGAKLLGVAKDALRGMLLLGAAEMTAADPDLGLLGTGDTKEEVAIAAAAPRFLPVLRQAEKAMKVARVETEGKTAHTTVSVAVSEKKLRAAVAAVVKLSLAGEGADVDAVFPFGTHRKEVAPPAPASASADPLVYYPGVNPSPAPSLREMGGMRAGTLPALPLQTALPPGDAALAPPAVLPPPPPPPGWVTPPPPAPVGVSIGMTPVEIDANGPPRPVPTPSAAATTVKLAVANVTKETATLFTEGEGGKLLFKQKVPAGEAVDLETTPGQRWVAVFADNPAGETHVAATDKTTWLLRHADRKEAKTPAKSAAVPMPRVPGDSTPSRQ